MDLIQCPCSGKSLDRLIRPALMALLVQEETHGYQLVQRLQTLTFFEDAPPDVSGVYKQLKTMQDDGLTTAEWETGDSGPAKRRYALTADGRACLRLWGKTLTRHRAQIDALLGVISQTVAADRPKPRRAGRKRTAVTKQTAETKRKPRRSR